MKHRQAQRVGQRIASECLAVRVRRLGRVVTRIYDAALAPHGVTIAQLNLLAAIALSGAARPVHLGRVLDLEKSTLSRDLKRMQQLGWVETRPFPEGRGSAVTLTPAGARLLTEAQGAWEKAQKAAQDELGSSAFKQLGALLTR